jgi:uncharacterized protein YpbB/energy-coupling factor transporter ATP-binding protein EcfA2
METNTQLALAAKILTYTGTHLFLTGKAGTGKTTFLKNLRAHSPKRMVVLAPTGVAAINAGGLTIHSFFQLGFAPFVPGTPLSKELFRFSKEKINIIRSMDLLVIDEISMVRADLLDAVDAVLRFVRKKEVPFGGVQLLMIGDLLQLAPVVKENEWNLLSAYYPSLFFFHSNALKQTSYRCVELKEIYRQSDEKFIHILNRVRENKITGELLEELNKRYDPAFSLKNREGYILLTTHNAQAQKINKERLDGISEPSFTFDAIVTGNFPEYIFPTEAKLELKKGAQVMFVKNDNSGQQRYFNGKIGIITHVDAHKIEVRSEKDSAPIVVEKARWTNMKYAIDPISKELKEEEEGAFEQYPLKTAWAITVHKSQGLTFEKAIVDVNASFAHGQVYVALSRCRTLDGLVLSSPVSLQAIKQDNEVNAFTENLASREPDEKEYVNLRKQYYVEMLFEQFSFTDLSALFERMLRLTDEYFGNLYPELVAAYKQRREWIAKEIMHVSNQFNQQLRQLIGQVEDPETDQLLQERIKKAAGYFYDKTTTCFKEIADKTVLETDNKEIRKKVNNTYPLFVTAIEMKLQTLHASKTNFSIPDYLEIKAKSSITDVPTKQSKQAKITGAAVSKDILHPELYEQLRSWRNQLAQEHLVPAYTILSQVALLGITNLLPVTSEQLLQVSGVGKMTLSRYGKQLLEMVEQCIRQYAYQPPKQTILPQETKKEPKIKTGEQTFLLFKQGKSLSEIAEERNLAVSTIEGHLLPYLQNGEIEINRLVDSEKQEKIAAAFSANPQATLSEIKAIVGEEYSWAELRFVKATLA